MSYSSTTTSTIPFRSIRNAQGVVTIEKYFASGNPNCGMALLLLVIAIILPASIAAVSPLASILLLVGSTFFPGILLFLINKKWSIDVDNYNRTLKITRWHDFNKRLKQVTSMSFDEIREIVAETSVDGTKRRLVAILLPGTRHVLYESMNIAHADTFKNLFMATIQLQGSSGLARTPQQPVVSPASTTSSSSPSTQPGTGSPGSPDMVVVPSLRQFAIPDPGLAPVASVASQSPLPAASFPAVARYSSSAGAQDLIGDTDGDGGPVSSTSTWVPGGHEGDSLPSEDPVDTTNRLAEIARRKREMLSRIYEPGTEPRPGPGATDLPAVTEPGTVVKACRPLKNVDDRYNEFDGCETLAYLFSPELGGRRPANITTFVEVRAGRAPKKKAGDTDDEDEIIEHKVDRKTERELDVEKVRPRCMVCTIPLKGTTFICPTCDTKYCIRCAKTLAGRKEYCWTCRKPLKVQ